MYVRRKVKALPRNRPETCASTPRTKKRVVCIGDSITQGTLSFNYVDALSSKPYNHDFEFINAGMGRDLAWNVLQRLDPVIDLKPGFITILIGSYEVDATLSHKREKKYKKSNKLPQIPSPEWFRENLNQILQRLQNETTAHIALISPPLVGEDLGEESNYWSAEYSVIVKEVAEAFGVGYLPLNERERELLQSLNHISRNAYKKNGHLIRRSAFRRYVLKKSWDDISEKNGFLLTPDLIHKNSKGGKIIIHLIDRFITRVEENKGAGVTVGQ
ncbi:MAG: GDSL-type esterase/lipase family protein [Balneolales bacterium]